MGFSTVQSVGRVGGGSKRRDYGMRVSYRKGWTSPTTGKSTSDQFVLTIDGDHLEDLGFDIYAAIMIDPDANELALKSVDEAEVDRTNGDLVIKFRDEKINKRDTGYRQLWISSRSCPPEVSRALDSIVDKSFDHNELYDISSDVGDPSFSFIYESVKVTETTADGGPVDEYSDVE